MGCANRASHPLRRCHGYRTSPIVASAPKSPTIAAEAGLFDAPPSGAGQGHRAIAARLGRPQATVRGWLRPFAARAEQTTSHAITWGYRRDLSALRVEPTAGATQVQAALQLVVWAAARAERFIGCRARFRWEVVSSLLSRRLLADTSCPYPPLIGSETLQAAHLRPSGA